LSYEILNGFNTLREPFVDPFVITVWSAVSQIALSALITEDETTIRMIEHPNWTDISDGEAV
jgi:hypothetical protein